MTQWQTEFQENQALWNELTAVHAGGTAYRLDEFKAGLNMIDPLERGEVGDVAGKSLLHLQCHFGMDTLSWARLGAHVTGVDFAGDAVALARKLSAELGLPAEFVQANLYDAPQALHATFDIVYTSWGALCWLPDLARWGQIIAHFLKPGGFFYIAESHPFLNVFYNEDDATGLNVTHSYFHQDEANYWPPDKDYAEPQVRVQHASYEWLHSVGEIQNALCDAGLRIDFFHEHPVLPWQYFPFMERGEDGWYRLPPGYPPLPLSFSLKASQLATN